MMKSNTTKIVVIGIGRMGKGIALTFAYAGYPLILVDSEARDDADFTQIQETAIADIQTELVFLNKIKVIKTKQIDAIGQQIQIISHEDGRDIFGDIDFVFETVSEILEIKKSVYSWLNNYLQDHTIVASATSTMLADTLAEYIHKPERFLNAHWLNPAHLMPLVELSPNKKTSAKVLSTLLALLENMGKTPVVCKASPGFIVSRIQALAMNEAARMVEEGVASAEDIDKAVKMGFGIRYATLGLLEFIDWGGGDILYHATNYLADNIDDKRFSVPENVKNNMTNKRNGLRDGVGFYNWQDCDVTSYREERMTAFIRLLQHLSLMPQAVASEHTPDQEASTNNG
ncbi:MAG: 3-hydroxybutyryl-CoA dehydrogenase [Gammaproteobacteria bacterium]|jgi:3-hydroxybutyryl-CoA dehydrogenase